MGKFLIASTFLGLSLAGFGQVPDSQELLRKIESIGQAPLSREFRNAFPDFFEHHDCPPQFNLSENNNGEDLDVFDLPQNDQLEAGFTILLLKEDCERFTHLSALASHYLPTVDAIIDSLKLPEVYRYLPLAQSLFNPFNEGGFYGLSVLDASRYGLKASSDVDLRNEFYTSTLSSYKRVADLHGDLKRPELVYLAFNEGFRQVKHRFENAGKDMDFFLESIPSYQLEWLYFIEVVADLYQLLQTPDYRSPMNSIASRYCEVQPAKPASKQSYEKVLQVDAQLLTELNPWLSGELVPVVERLPLKLPAGTCEYWILLEDSVYNYEKALEEQRRLEQARLEAERASHLPSGDTHVEKTHVVKSGEVLGSIANRYGVKVSDIREWNEIKRDVIYVGQKLLIYVPKGKAGKQESAADEGEREEEPITGDEFVWYTVRTGDNLWLIAREFPGVSAEDIMEWNEVDENLRPGQKLKIYKRD